jgi:hypothetical protein
MFVLDVTGSMTATDAGNGMSRIQALRNAVMNFYDTVKASTSATAQVRFGAVPYSMSVNVLNVLPRTHLASSHTYQSRRFVNELISEETDVLIPRDLNDYPNPSDSQRRYRNNSGPSVRNADRELCQITNQGTFDIGEVRYVISGNTYQLSQFTGGDSGWRAGCRATVRQLRAYRYEPRTFDVSAGAFDLNINLVPTTDAQRWKPALPEAIWSRPDPTVVHAGENYTRPSRTCSTASFRLTDISRPNLQTFVDSLVPTGNTYHDIGMIWGARLISPNGLFAADNTSAPNGDPISRHIVFMSDGQLEPSLGIYGMYGVERMDRRISGNGDSTTQRTRHEARFQAACSAAKNENITVWVVAFGTTLSQSLRDCASPGRAYEASDSAQLEAAFQEIAQKIAALRLTS